MARVTKWKYRARIVAPVTDVDAINDAVASNLDKGSGDLTLSVEILPGQFWCCSKLTRTGVFGGNGAAGLLQLAPNFPLATGYVWPEPADADLTAELEAAFADVPNVSVGEMTGQEVLADLGN